MDLLWTVNALARMVTKWNVACDKRLHRLISYMHNTTLWEMICYVGDEPQNCKIAQFSDASFGGDLTDSKSITGAYLCLVGPNTRVPLAWMCKKQGAVSHSSTEAEMIALEAGMRMEGIPALILWSPILEVLVPKGKRDIIKRAGRNASHNILYVDYVPQNADETYERAKLMIFEDNEAVIKLMLKSRAATTRHVPRTHRIDLDWLIERFLHDKNISIRYIGTKEQVADFLTKGSFVSKRWLELCLLAQIGDGKSRSSRQPESSRPPRIKEGRYWSEAIWVKQSASSTVFASFSVTKHLSH